MSRGLASALLVVGIIIIAFGALEHWVLKIAVFNHFSSVIGVVGVIIAVLGVWGLMRRQSA